MSRFKNYAISCFIVAFLIFPLTTLGQTQDPTTPAGKFRKSKGRVIPNRYIVVLRDDVVSNDAPLEVRRAGVTEIARKHAETYGGTFDYIYETALKGYAIQLPDEAAAIAISKLPEVRWVEEDALGEWATGVVKPQAAQEVRDRQHRKNTNSGISSACSTTKDPAKFCLGEVRRSLDATTFMPVALFSLSLSGPAHCSRGPNTELQPTD